MLDVRRIAETVLEPHRADRAGAVEIEGPAVQVPARQGRMLGLGFHELATNAAKYGALSRPEGAVRLRWNVSQSAGARRLSLSWEERNGPPVTPPDRDGFGTRLLRDVLRHELDGQTQIAYGPGGPSYRLEFPIG